MSLQEEQEGVDYEVPEEEDPPVEEKEKENKASSSSDESAVPSEGSSESDDSKDPAWDEGPARKRRRVSSKPPSAPVARAKSRKDWDTVTDVSALRAEIRRLQGVVLKLEAAPPTKIVLGGGQKGSSITPAAAVTLAGKVQRALVSKTKAMMQYKRDSRYSAKSVTAAHFNFPALAWRNLLGVEYIGQGTIGPARHSLELSEDAFTAVLGTPPTKSLRYGSCLELQFPVKLVYNKKEEAVRLSGKYVMR